MPAICRNVFADGDDLIENLFNFKLFPANWQALLDKILLSLPESGAALVWRLGGDGNVEIMSAGLGAKAKATLRKLMASGTLEAASGRNPRETQITLDIGSANPAVLFVASRAGRSADLAGLRNELAARHRELRRAFAVLDFHYEHRRALDRFDRLLAARDAPTLIVNGAGQVLAANVRARRAIGEARLVDLARDGTLRLRAGGAREPLSKTLSDIERPALVGYGAPSSRSEDGAGQDLLVIIPLPESRASSVTQTREFALVIRKLFSPPTAAFKVLKGAFGFTQAEARLVAALASGAVVGRYARDNKIKQSTVRWHLRNALEKTGCKTHTDLIRLALFMLSW
jgi:DNA-binding CsgD family transcriptional regulator